jgi:hypothetical protein
VAKLNISNGWITNEQWFKGWLQMKQLWLSDINVEGLTEPQKSTSQDSCNFLLLPVTIVCAC